MAISNVIQRLLSLFHLRTVEIDQVLDYWIHDALLDDALAQPPQGTWERLRMVLERRRTKRHGMWILDEPLRDPPEMLPTALSYAQFERAYRIYSESRPYAGWNTRTNIFTHPLPTFWVLVNY